MCGPKLKLEANRNYIRRYFKNFQVTGCTDPGGTFLILWFLSFFLLLWGSLSSRPISQPVLLKSHICPRGFVSLLRSFLTSPACGQNVDNEKKKKTLEKEKKKKNKTGTKELVAPSSYLEMEMRFLLVHLSVSITWNK